jgi:glycosyltransferase involved in cell wall biosynthesis
MDTLIFVSLGGIFFLLLWCFLLLLVRKVLLFSYNLPAIWKFALFLRNFIWCGVVWVRLFTKKLLIVVRVTLKMYLNRGKGVVSLNPLVSVIIPTYCEETTIDGCLKSVVNQHFEYGAIESIVVDSHSPDKTREVAKRSADKVIDLRARGVGKARNEGVRVASGQLLLFLDADTYLESNFVSEMYHAFNDPRVVCMSGVLKNLEKLAPLDNLFAVSHYEFLNKLASISARLGFPMFASVCCAARKDAFLKVGGFAEDIACGEDVTFSRKMGKVGKCVVNPKATAYTSVRRISNCGKVKMYSMYFKNYVKLFLLNQKPWVQDFPHINTTEI